MGEGLKTLVVMKIIIAVMSVSLGVKRVLYEILVPQP